MDCKACRFLHYDDYCSLLKRSVQDTSFFGLHRPTVKPDDCPIEGYKDYDPPKENCFKRAYHVGFGEGFRGEPFDDTKYPGNGYELETTLEDELAQAYYSGHSAGLQRKWRLDEK